MFDSQNDLEQVIRGPSPASDTGRAKATDNDDSDNITMSPHYARTLVELARQRGFDGYLVAFEDSFNSDGTKWARAVSAWVSLLREEMLKAVGPHAEVIWYVPSCESSRLIAGLRLCSVGRTL